MRLKCLITGLILILFIPLRAYSEKNRIDGTFVYLGDAVSESLPSGKLQPYFQEMRDLDLSVLVIQALRVKEGTCREGKFSWIKGMPSKLKAILDGAHRVGMKVYVGLVSTMNVCPAFYDAINAKEAALETFRVADAVHALYENHPALAGWYIPDEPANLDKHLLSYFKTLVSEIRKHSSKPIMVSPYLKGVKSTPEALAQKARVFKKATGVNIQAWQDSRGADAFLESERYYKALFKELGEGLWANLELFNWGSDLFKGGGYSPASLYRLNDQLWQVRTGVATKRLSWLGQLHLGTVDPAHRPESRRLNEAYKALFLGKGKITRPLSYAYLSPFSTSYPDHGGELTDTRIGDPKDHRRPEWVGVMGPVTVVFDLGEKKKISWVSVHLLNASQAGIKFPTRMELTCEENGKRLGTDNLQVGMADSEYVFSNSRKIEDECRKIRFQLPNDGWSFLSEVEFVAQ